ncbi:hypothetical protein ACIXT0_20380 [Bacteroides fragilis]
MNAATEIIENIFKEKPLDLYDYILRGPFCDIYTEFKKTHKDDCRNYSSLLIDKFAIHSASFFHTKIIYAVLVLTAIFTMFLYIL